MCESRKSAQDAPTIPQGRDRATLPCPTALGLEPTPLEREPAAPPSVRNAWLRLLGGSILLVAGSCDISAHADLSTGLDNGTVSRAEIERPEEPSGLA